jgi:hypothetical protein
MFGAVQGNGMYKSPALSSTLGSKKMETCLKWKNRKLKVHPYYIWNLRQELLNKLHQCPRTFHGNLANMYST